MLFIFNPNTSAGRLRSRLMDIVCYFSTEGYKVTLSPTAAKGDAQTFAQDKSGGYDIVVCCGGDGTLNEVVNGLCALQNPPLLGYIPGGTTNDFASSLLLPKTDMMAAAKRVAHPKKVYHCDVGMFNQHAFTYVAAFGAFTEVSYSTPQAFKNVLGYFAYILEAMQKLPKLHSYSVEIETSAGILQEEILFGMVSNSTSVGGFSFLGKDKVHMDDGLFEILMIRHPHNLNDLREISGALLSRNIQSPWLIALQEKQVKFSFGSPTPWTLDGEYGGDVSTAAIAVKQKALAICI